jgi:hypothetical protein
MRRPSVLLLLIAALATMALAAGCGAIRSTVGIVQADKLVRQAQEAGGAEAAPYPMEVAEDLLRKAREEQGYADYSRSFQLAREARTMAQKVLDEAPAPPVAPLSPDQGLVIDPSLWADDDDSAGDDDDSAGDDDDSAGDDDDSAGDDDDSAGDDDDSAGDDDDSAGDDDDSAGSP